MLEKPSCTRMTAISWSTSSLSMNRTRAASCSASLLAVTWSCVITLSCQPVSLLARRTFWPPRPIAWDSLSSATAMSIECFSSSMMIDCTSAGAIALMTNWAGFSCHRMMSTRSPLRSLETLHARTAHADARADRVGAAVVGHHGDLGAVARIAGAALDLDQALADFRHFQLEQLDHELRCGARHEQLRPAHFGLHFEQVAAHAVAHAHRLARNGLVARDEGLGVAAQVEVDVAALDALDDAGDQLAHAILVGVHHLLALGFAHALHDHLLGGLRRDAAELGVLDLRLDVLTHLGVGALVQRVHQAQLVERRLHLAVV